MLLYLPEACLVIKELLLFFIHSNNPFFRVCLKSPILEEIEEKKSLMNEGDSNYGCQSNCPLWNEL